MSNLSSGDQITANATYMISKPGTISIDFYNLNGATLALKLRGGSTTYETIVADTAGLSIPGTFDIVATGVTTAIDVVYRLNE